jgi:hypothetical protein
MMGRLTFANADLVALVRDATDQWPKGVRETFGQDETVPGFWLVGDHGVYLMHNGIERGTPNQVYARECNPDTMEFDVWWHQKEATFGGDDGVEYIEPAFIINAACDGHDLMITFEEDAFTIAAIVPIKDKRQ